MKRILFILFVFSIIFTAQAQDAPGAKGEWEARISAWPMVQNALNLFDGKDTTQLYQELAMVYRMPKSEIRIQGGGFYHRVYTVRGRNSPGGYLYRSIRERYFYGELRYAYHVMPFLQIGVSGFGWHTYSDYVFTTGGDPIPGLDNYWTWGGQIFTTAVIPLKNHRFYIDFDIIHLSNQADGLQWFGFSPKPWRMQFTKPTITLWVPLR